MEVLCVGASSCMPDIGGETASLLVNGKHLIDTGWTRALRLRELGKDLLQVESVLFTHMHHDHCLGLPQLLFYQAMERPWREAPAGLRILGPAEHLSRVVETAWQMLQVERFPELRYPVEVAPLRGGDGYDLGGVRVEARTGRHVSGQGAPEPALNYRLTEATTGECVVYSGDTSYDPGLGEWARGAQLLIHDAAHTTAAEAAQVAAAAGVAKLVLIHCNRAEAPRLLAEARAIFPATEVASFGAYL